MTESENKDQYFRLGRILYADIEAVENFQDSGSNKVFLLNSIASSDLGSVFLILNNTTMARYWILE